MSLSADENHKSETSMMGEVAGALGDLGTFLPHVLASITVAGLNPTSVFAGFGLFYLFSGCFYRIPMAVQPMKAASATVLVSKLGPEEVAATGIIMGLCLLFLGLSGLIDKIANWTPLGVSGGIQVGLGLSLAILGLKFVYNDPLIGAVIVVGMLLLMVNRRFPAAIFALVAGIILDLFLNPGGGTHSLHLGFSMPALIFPSMADFKNTFLSVALPQLPLTLTNAVLVTAAVSNQLYGRQARRATEKNLCLTMGMANLMAAPLGGYMMCHGSGGVAAHHRFGGRTMVTAFIIGSLLLLCALLLGKGGVELLRYIPDAALGGLLFFSGIDLALGARGVSKREDFYIILLVSAITLSGNPAIAFLAGIAIHKGIEFGIIKI